MMPLIECRERCSATVGSVIRESVPVGSSVSRQDEVQRQKRSFNNSGVAGSLTPRAAGLRHNTDRIMQVAYKIAVAFERFAWDRTYYFALIVERPPRGGLARRIRIFSKIAGILPISGIYRVGCREPVRETSVFTLRQDRKAEFLRDYRAEANAAAALLGDELKGLRFYFATISQDYDRSRSTTIEFHGDGPVVWVRAKGDQAVKVLDQPR